MKSSICAGFMVVAASVLAAQPVNPNDPPMQDGKTIRFGPNCSGSARIIETRLREEDEHRQMYHVRVEFKHACDAPFRPYMDIVAHAKRKGDGVLVSIPGQIGHYSAIPTIFPGDASPVILDGYITIYLETMQRGLATKPYISGMKATPRRNQLHRPKR